jgi:hypothetical protein
MKNLIAAFLVSLTFNSHGAQAPDTTSDTQEISRGWVVGASGGTGNQSDRAPPNSPDDQLLSTITLEGKFRIYGHEPIPQVNGFDYYFSPVALDPALRGKKIRVSRVEVSVSGKSNGAVVNWDIEIFAGPSSFGLPVGQFVQTRPDPVSAYKRTAPVHTRLSTQKETFITSVSLPLESQRDVILDEGLRAQVFLWTADNRNCNLDISNVSLRFFGQVL